MTSLGITGLLALWETSTSQCAGEHTPGTTKGHGEAKEPGKGATPVGTARNLGSGSSGLASQEAEGELAHLPELPSSLIKLEAAPTSQLPVGKALLRKSHN